MITKSVFDRFVGKDIYSYTMTNKNGASATVITWGGILQSVKVPDKNGVLADVVCGFDTVKDYFDDRGSHTGALIGRYGNRIAGGGFEIDGTFYKINNNEVGRWHLHGGLAGFNRRVWESEAVENEDSDSVILTLFSPHLDEGYPGNLNVKVTYTWDDDNVLSIRYEAETDMKTVLNMTNHAYFNLNGYDGGSVMDQELMINADTYDDLDDKLIPLGYPTEVSGTAFDFRTMRKIAQPYDHSFQLKGEIGKMRLAAEACDPESGRTMKVYTDLPAVQLYTAEFMNGPTLFKGGVPQRPLHAFCLETQFSPNTPNRPYMPQCYIDPEHPYFTETAFEFGVK